MPVSVMKTSASERVPVTATVTAIASIAPRLRRLPISSALRANRQIKKRLILALAAIVAALGQALTALPINVLRLVVGGLLLVFGLQWLRKAILRASGYKALHDEGAIFAAETASLRAAGEERRGIDPFGFTVSFKGVLLEGLEVAFIVVTFGANRHNVPLAAIAAGCSGAARAAERNGRAATRRSSP